MELAEDISDEYLTCTICFEPFIDPKQLPCLHTFCKRCLSSHISYNVRGSGHLHFSCPVCRKITKPANPDPRELANWADQFPNNFFIISLKDTLESYNIEAGSIARGSTSKEGDEQCPKHGGIAMHAYCTEEKVGVCSECESKGHSTCQQYHLKTPDAKTKAENSLGDLKRNINTLKESVTDIKDGLNAKPRLLRLQKEKLTLDISEHFTALKKIVIEQLLHRECETIEKLTELVKSEEGSNESLSKECDSLSGSLDRTVKLFEKLLSKGSINALCMLDKIASQVDGYKQVINNLESESKDNAFSFVPEKSDLQEMLEKVHIGDINVNDDTLVVNLGNKENKENSNIDSSSSDSEVLDSCTHSIEPSAPPIEEKPSGWEGFLPESLSHDLHHQAAEEYSPSSYGQQSSILATRELQIPTDVPMDFYISHEHSFSANSSHNERSGGCADMSAVFEDHVAVVDRFNKTLKILDIIRGRIKMLVSFGEREPWDITYIRDSYQLAVTFPADKNICFYETQGIAHGQCQRIASIKTRYSYMSLSALKTGLFAAGIGQPYGHPDIHILDRTGTVITNVEARIKYPRHLQTTSNGKLVVCDWTNKEVLLIDDSYQVETLYRGTYSNELKDPTGVACDSQGWIYILDRKTRTIHVLDSRSGKCTGVLYAENVPQPRLLTVVQTNRRFCRREEVLAVVDFSNIIHIFKITDNHDFDYFSQV
ncbi:E3 ubiquitin-protein ligase TRIM32-like [Gigantopelta aegis]|uniref:E3 ubiquitin-protein ligase TRIM32-like n=1 Tax=Gigantopelta aegis TaxID=1735272 RepID=UPI001B887F4B|nr:E3 ubiquitin-protein ligase TRIM32-like [Gigantopelta aegis]